MSNCFKMAQEEEGNNFKYCKVCRVHYGNGRKHRYGKSHIKSFDLIISKFRKKVTDCQQYLKSPEAVDGELEPGAAFWCHFCEQRVQKHVTDRTSSIKFGGLFQHFSSNQHHKKTHIFWKENGGDKKLKKDFLITSEVYTGYQLRCRESLDKLSEEMNKSWVETAEKIKSNEMERSMVFSEQHHLNQTALQETRTVTNVHGVMQNPSGWHDGVRVWRGGIVKIRSKSAFHRSVQKWNHHAETRTQVETETGKTATNLPVLSVVHTSINDQSKRRNIGNIHTGALPPWLRNDDDGNADNMDAESPIIGPSFEDFKQHVAKTKKKKSSLKSVGVNFDHTEETSDNWLPSFGRVWNSGPRWQSRHEYRNEKKKGKRT